MNRTDRLLAIVLELQGKGERRAEDLAALFETSKRTIYRDIAALCEAGVPIRAAPGRGYSLMEGYFLPPLSFTGDEAVTLLLGGDYMAQNFDAQYRAAAESAGRKIAAALPGRLREEVQALQGGIRFIASFGDNPDRPAELATLQRLRRAILERRTVRFRYHARHPPQGAPATTIRQVDPYGLVHLTGSWYLAAWDHGRRDIRHFRLDRIDALEPLERTFTRPPGFAIGRREGGEDGDRDVTIRALFDPEVARWVREARSFYVVDEREGDDPPGLLVTLRVRQEREVLGWLLGWGRHVRVLEPESLRRRLAEETGAMLRNHQDARSLLT